jgi:phage gp29-like protein
MVRIAGFDIIRAARARSYEEIGVTGTSVSASGGNIILTQEDYNPDLRGNALYEQWDRMRLSDSQVKAVMSIIKLPLRAADWGIEPPTDKPRDKEIADWIADRLFNGQMRTWDYVLHHMLLSLDFGSMPMEIVWDVRDDDWLHRPMLHLKKLAPRMPKSILEWRLSDEGELDSILQQGEKAGHWKEIEIPGDKLLIFVHDMEGANYKGTSILRQARKDWHIKERLQRINQVAIEKRAAGIDVGTLPEGGTPEQKTAFESVLQTIRTHERAYVLEPEGHKYRVEGITGSVLDPLPSIQYCDIMILRSILADYLTSGSGSEGSYALVRDRSSFFLMSLGAIANEITSPINRYLIPQWVNYNWPNVTEYPRLTHSRLDRRDVAAVAEALKGLIPVGVITPDDTIEQELRELLELPDMPEHDGQELAELAKKDGEDLVSAYRKAKAPKRPYEVREGRSVKARTPLEKSVDWVALERGLDDATDKIVSAYTSVQRRQIDKVVDEGMKAITADKTADERAEMLENINIPYRREAAAQIGKVLADLYGLGQREVRQEMARQGGEPLRLAMPLDGENDSVIKRFLRFRALAVVAVLSDRLKGSLLNNGLNMIREGETDRMMLSGALTALSERAIKSAAGETVSEAMNLGRESVAKRNKNLVEEVVYSAILDDNLCESCAGLDGTTYELGTQAYEDAKPPRPAGGPIEECHGRNRCRCTYIYRFRSEAPARR